MDDGWLKDTALVVRVPFRPDTIHYRAYAEQLNEGSVLDWLIARLLASRPAGIRALCVCTGKLEHARITSALTTTDGICLAAVEGRNEPEFCQLLMTKYQASRLIMVTFCHAVAPRHVLGDVLRSHERTHTELTIADAPAFSKPLYVIESAMADRLVESSAHGGPTDVVEAVRVLFASKPSDGAASPWQQLKIPALCHLDPSRWPETITIETSNDVEIMRRAIPQPAAEDSTDEQLLCSWKSAAIALRLETASKLTTEPRGSTSVVSKPIRVLYLSTLSHFVGATQTLCHLIEGLDRERVEPVAMVPYTSVLADELRRRGVRTVNPNMDVHSPTYESIVLAQQIIEDVKPDVVHAIHTVGLPLIAFARASGVPLVQHVCLANAALFKLELHAADMIIAVSEFVRRRVLTLEIDPARVVVIFDSVDDREFRLATLADKREARKRLGVPEHEFVVSIVARMTKQKRIDTVIKAMGLMRRTAKVGHLLLVAPRDSDSSHYEQIDKLIEHEGITTHTTRFDYLQDVPSVFHASDAMALLSKDEALGRVVVEAMASGLPVVVGDSGGSQELVDHGSTGFVVRYGQAGELAAVLCDLAFRPDRAAAIGMAAARKVRSMLTSALCAEKTMAIYDRVLAPSHSQATQRFTSAVEGA